MLGGELHRLLKLGAPRRLGLADAGVDQVERHAGEDRLAGLHRGDRLGDSVAAAEGAQVRVVERLHADRDAVDAGVTVAAKAAGLDAGRVRLQRDLGVRLDRPARGDRLEDRADGGRRHQRRRAAAEEDRAHLASRRQRRAMGDLALESGDEPLFVGRRGADVAVEIAIGALRQAERPVNVNGEPGIAEARQIRHRGDGFDSAHRHVMPAPAARRHRH